MLNRFAVFGVDYKSSDFAIRERMAVSRGEMPQVLTKLRSLGIVTEMVILSTCNRTEIYCIGRDIDLVINALGEIKNLCPKTVIRKHCYIHSGTHAVRHLFRVISGLESMVLGESEIVAQVKEAFNISREYGLISRNLSGIFQMALAVEKEIRSSTEINQVAISMGRAVANLVAVNYADILPGGILFIGAGEMMRTIIPHFKNTPQSKKAVINRTLSKAEELATKIAAKAFSLGELPNIINNYSVIVVCCSGGILITQELLSSSIKNKTELVIIDLSVPLVTDLYLNNHENITLITVDDIAKIVDVGVEKRKTLALHAESIISGKLEEYQKWKRKRGLSPLIRALRERAEDTRLEVLLDAKRQLANGLATEELLQELSVKLTNKLIHSPTVNLCAAEGLMQDDLVSLVSHLYELDVSNDGEME
jgi:glutamyl-tRNA reductase